MNSISIEQTVADRVADALVRHDVEFLFAQSLPSAVVLAAEERGIRQISYRQENMGGVMADGYARLSGKVGVVAAQNGPAATLLVPPLAEALKASVPIVALVQEVDRNQADRNAFQELDHMGLFQSCTKWVRRVQVEDEIDRYVDQAFTAAASGRPGPVALLLPADLLRARMETKPSSRHASLGRYPLDRPRPGDDAVVEAARLVIEAKTPIVLAGGGVHGARASDALSRLQELACLPVCTTNMGKGAVNEFHPLSLGVLGSLTGPRSLGVHTRAIVETADLVILVGTRTNQNGTDNWSQIPRSATIIHIDMDPQEIGRNYEAFRLVGDARETLNALCDVLEREDLSGRLAARAGIEQEVARCWAGFEAARHEVWAGQGAPIRPERVMKELQPFVEKGLTVVADASYSSMWVVGQLRTSGSQSRIVTPRGLAGLGWGVPLAIGARLAAPQKPVVAVVGDGGFAHSWAELETMARHGIPVVTIVLNNGILGFQRDAETVKFGRYTSACHFAPVDHAALARACGCRSARVEDPADLAGVLATAIASGSPFLVEVMTDPEAHPALSLFAAMDEAA